MDLLQLVFCHSYMLIQWILLTFISAGGIHVTWDVLVQATPKPTTEAQPVVEYEDEEFDEEAPAEESVTTTTEAPKKGGLRTGVVRPFRSNADLIEALKRRRQQQGNTTLSLLIQYLSSGIEDVRPTIILEFFRTKVLVL